MIFHNSHFEHYILADLNADLINLFNVVKNDVENFIETSREIFQQPDANSADFYYLKREEFNRTSDIFRRSTLFLYLNRFGYNGLCRYNNKELFNVPFGAYIKPYFPEQERFVISAKKRNKPLLSALLLAKVSNMPSRMQYFIARSALCTVTTNFELHSLFKQWFQLGTTTATR